MNVIYEPGGELESCVFETTNKCKIRCLMSPKEPEIITIDDSEDEEKPEDNQCSVKIKEAFPCANSSGCNINRKGDEPEHLLRCLLVKLLTEIDTPSIHIESICTALSKRYEYFFTTPIYRLVQGIKDLIQIGDFPNNIRIVLDEKGYCFLLRTEWNVVDLDTEDEEMEDIREKLKIEMLTYMNPVSTEPKAAVAAPKPKEGVLLAAIAAPKPEDDVLLAAVAVPKPKENVLLAAVAAPKPKENMLLAPKPKENVLLTADSVLVSEKNTEVINESSAIRPRGLPLMTNDQKKVLYRTFYCDF